MKCPTRIIIRLEKTHVDELDFNGGKIWYDHTYRPEWNAFPYGEVVAVPLRDPDMGPGFFHNVEVGDRLYFNYGVVGDEANYLGDNLWVVDYFQALATVRDKKLYPVGNHILITVEKEKIENKHIVIPELYGERKLTQGFVHASNEKSIPVGSKVLFEEIGMFENKIEGVDLYVMFNDNILGILT
jgi:co-chaperonin GroES (HSP10)